MSCFFGFNRIMLARPTASALAANCDVADSQGRIVCDLIAIGGCWYYFSTVFCSENLFIFPIPLTSCFFLSEMQSYLVGGVNRVKDSFEENPRRLK